MNHVESVLDRILQAQVVVIFRGLTPDACVQTATALHEGGVRGFEVTLNSPGALDAIARLRAELPDDTVIGAGTVLSPDEVVAARDAGAQFVISPNVDGEVIACTRAEGLVSIPGAQTATEVLAAHGAGAHIVKIFPIRPLGADYIALLRGPIADVPFMATGGVDAVLAQACLAAGAQTIGVGLQVFAGRPDEIDLADAARRYLSVAQMRADDDQ